MGRIDVLINAGRTDAPNTVEELDVECWDRTSYVNTGAPFCCPRPPPSHRGDGSGTLINVSSVAGKKGRANATSYCAFKFGLTDYTEPLTDDVHL